MFEMTNIIKYNTAPEVLCLFNFCFAFTERLSDEYENAVD